MNKKENGSATSHNKTTLQAEANKNKLVIDKSVFIKTKEEKEKLKIAKAEYKLKKQVI
jgi:hypothetical protein